LWSSEQPTTPGRTLNRASPRPYAFLCSNKEHSSGDASGVPAVFQHQSVYTSRVCRVTGCDLRSCGNRKKFGKRNEYRKVELRATTIMMPIASIRSAPTPTLSIRTVYLETPLEEKHQGYGPYWKKSHCCGWLREKPPGWAERAQIVVVLPARSSTCPTSWHPSTSSFLAHSFDSNKLHDDALKFLDQGILRNGLIYNNIRRHGSKNHRH
jgi:hypothetical protein